PSDSHPTLKDFFERVVCLPLSLPVPKSRAEIVDYGIRLLSSQPYLITKYCRSKVNDELRALLQHETYDVIVCDFLSPAGIIPWESQTPKVVFTHNVEAVIWRRHYEVATNPLWKAISWWEWRKTAAAEKRYLRLADRVLTVSDTDRDSFATFLDPRKISIIATGVDVDYFQPLPGAEIPDSLVFTGSMDWLPNEDAIFYFVEAILPLIKQQHPSVSLEVVGRNPSRKLQALLEAEKSVRLTGWVEDIRPFLARGSACIVPLRIGGGTRLKIFEAMAMGKAVVSTTVGAEGLPVTNGTHVMVADDPASFARAVVVLIRDADRRQQLEVAARALVVEKYDWSAVAGELEIALVRFAGRRAGEINPCKSPSLVLDTQGASRRHRLPRTDIKIGRVSCRER